MRRLMTAMRGRKAQVPNGGPVRGMGRLRRSMLTAVLVEIAVLISKTIEAC